MNRGTNNCGWLMRNRKDPISQKRKRGFPDAVKNEKKTETTQAKKFLSARKKLSTQECGETKEGGFPCFVGGTTMF